MSALPVILGLLPIAAAFALTRRRRLDAIIGMAVFSLLLASVFFLLHAPDVAITEAAVGAALVTFIYVLAIRKTGRLTVVASEVPGLIERAGGQITGFEYEILERLAGRLGLDLVVQFVAREEIEDILLRGDADLGAGGILSDSDHRLLWAPPHLPTARFVIASRGPAAAVTEPVPFRGYVADTIDAVRRRSTLCMTVDLARFLAISRQNLDAYDVRRIEEDAETYAFVLGRSRGDLHRQLSALIVSLRASGDLDEMARRHFP